MHLYEMTEQQRKLLDMDTSTPEDAEAFNALMDELGDTISDKVERSLIVARELDLEAEKFASEIDRLKAAKQAIDNKSKNLREYVKYNLIAQGWAPGMSSEFGTFKVRFQQSPGKLELTGEIPDEYYKREVDLSACKEAVKNGATFGRIVKETVMVVR